MFTPATRLATHPESPNWAIPNEGGFSTNDTVVMRSKASREFVNILRSYNIRQFLISTNVRNRARTGLVT